MTRRKSPRLESGVESVSAVKVVEAIPKVRAKQNRAKKPKISELKNAGWGYLIVF